MGLGDVTTILVTVFLAREEVLPKGLQCNDLPCFCFIHSVDLFSKPLFLLLKVEVQPKFVLHSYDPFSANSGIRPQPWIR